MICPHCNVSFFEEWESTGALVWDDDCKGQGLKYAQCPNCSRLIVRIIEGPVDLQEQEFVPREEDDKATTTNEFTVYPVPDKTDLSEDVPENYRQDYLEAKSVVDISPKASAAISRRLLQNLLRDQMGIKNANLSKQIEGFLDLKDVPSYLSRSIDAVRNVGNFAAHPNKETSTGEIVEVEPGEADWLLEVLMSMFDFLFIQPKRIEIRRNELNEKLRSMGKPEMKG